MLDRKKNWVWIAAHPAVISSNFLPPSSDQIPAASPSDSPAFIDRIMKSEAVNNIGLAERNGALLVWMGYIEVRFGYVDGGDIYL